MEKRTIILFCALYTLELPRVCFAGFEPLVSGARAAGMGETGSLIQPDVFDPCSNPASLGNLPCSVAGSYYAALFGMKELSHGGALVGLHSPAGGFGIGGSSFGNELYSETQIFLGLGKTIGPSLHAGFSLTAGTLKIRGYGSRHVLFLNAGFFYVLKKCVSLGGSVRNLFQARIGQSSELVPQGVRLQCDCLPVTGIRFSIELFKDVRFAPELRGGLEVMPLPGMYLRCGFIHSPQVLTSGAGFTINRLNINYAIVIHPSSIISNRFRPYRFLYADHKAETYNRILSDLWTLRSFGPDPTGRMAFREQRGDREGNRRNS
jgi:hypothetical protein